MATRLVGRRQWAGGSGWSAGQPLANRRLLLLLFVTVYFFACIQAADTRSHLYLSDQRVITLEWADAETAIVNVINLSNEFLVVRPDFVVLVDADRTAHYGQVIADKKEKGGRLAYRASAVLKPREFSGYTILGPFDLKGGLQQVAVRLGGRVFFLEALESDQFERMAKRIAEIDLESENPERALEQAGIQHRFGTVRFRGDPESRETAELFPDREVVAPVIVQRSEPQYTQQAREAKVEGTLLVEGLVTRSGDFLNGKVLRGLGHGLDERTLETIKNSWRFLPALKDGEIAEATITLKIEFKLEQE